MYTHKDLCELIKSLIIPAVFILAAINSPLISSDLVLAQESVIRHITQSTERLELTVNSSRILTLEKPIPRMVVNNPELVSVTALSKNQIQIAARKTGVTQINLWDDEDNVFSVDIMIYGDVRELQLALKWLFPKSSVKVIRLTNSLVLEGFVEEPFVHDFQANFYVSTLNVPIFRNEDGYWERNVDGKFEVDHWEELAVLFSLPDIEIVEKQQPYPLIIWGQGLGGKGALGWGIFASIGISRTLHYIKLIPNTYNHSS